MMEQVRATFAWVIPFAILLATCGGYFLARKSLAPVVAMSDKAARIGAENLSERQRVCGHMLLDHDTVSPDDP